MKITHDVVLIVETCCTCGAPFGMEENFQRGCKKDGSTFYCPNGHAQHYADTTEAKLARSQRELQAALESEAWWKGHAERKARQLSATKGVLTKTKKRIQGGACPCCNRQFTNLHRHMQSQHPDYSTKEEEGKEG